MEDLIRYLSGKKEKPFNYQKIEQTLGPWRPFTGPSSECIPGTRLPKVIRWTERRFLLGTKECKIDFALGVVTHWLRLNPKLLRFIAYILRDEEKYRRIEIPRPNGEPRFLEEPIPLLKFIQRRILRRILEQTDLPPCVHGFVRGRSIATCAEPHVGKPVVVCCDIRNFFPSINVKRIHGIFRSLIINPRISNLLAALTTYQGRLPQGAPTSPMLANLVCRRLDRRLMGLAKALNLTYTRYADDLIFSGGPQTPKILRAVRAFLAEEGFELNEEKTRILRRGRRQQICGVVVNDRVGIPRPWRRKLRAEVHRVTVTKKPKPGQLAQIKGKIAFLNAFKPEEAQKYAQRLKAALEFEGE